MDELVIRGAFKIDGTLVDGTGHPIMTRDSSSKAVGTVPPIDDSSFVSASLPSTQILVGNVSGVATARTLSGDATLSNTGVLSLLPISNSHISTTAAIASTKIALATDSILKGVAGVATASTDLPTATTIGTAYLYRVGGTDVSLADGGTGASLADPGGDRILFWDESANASSWLTVGSGLTITDTTIDSTVSAAALTRVNDTNVTLALGGSPNTALLAATSLTLGWTGELAATRGGTGFGSYAVGDLLYASTTSELAKLADVAAGSYLRSGGVNTAPSWSTLILPNNATAGQVVFATSTDTYGGSTGLTFSSNTLTVIGAAATDGTVVLSINNSTPAGLYSIRNSGRATSTIAVNHGGSASFTFTNSTTVTLTNDQTSFYSTGNYSISGASARGINMLILPTMTTGATGQMVVGIDNRMAAVTNHTTASVTGYNFEPNISGSQTPSNVYALRATTGKINLANYTNASVGTNDFWFETNTPLLGIVGTAKRVLYTSLTGPGVNQIMYSSTQSELTASSNFTFTGSLLTLSAPFVQSVSAVHSGGAGGAGFISTIGHAGINFDFLRGWSQTGTSTIHATSGRTYSSNYWGHGITTGATNQILFAHQIEPAFTASHTGATAYGIRYNPTIAGTQTASLIHEAWHHTAGYIRWASVLTPAQITSNQNDYNPTGWTSGGAPHGATHIRVTSDAPRNITSLAGGLEGRLAVISNVGSQNVVLTDDDGATGTAGNRFALPANATLLPDQSVLAIYDDTSDRWRLVRGADSLPFSSLTAATATNTIDNAGFLQRWQWVSVTTGGLVIEAPSATTSTNNSQLVRIERSGGHAGSSIATSSLAITNSHTGTGSINIALQLSASGGSSGNRALQVNSGDVRLASGVYITDANNNELLKFTQAASAVNEITIGNSATGLPVTVSATGDDSNIELRLVAKGSSGVSLYNEALTSGLIVASAITGVGTDTASFRTDSSSATNTVVHGLFVGMTTTGTPAAGIGTGVGFTTLTAAGNTEYGGFIESVTTDVGAGTEDFDFTFRLMAGGATASEKFRMSSDGAFYIGPSTTNGSWRFIQSGDDLLLQQREAGTYNTKHTFSGA